MKGLLLTMAMCLATYPTTGCASRHRRDPDQSQIRYQLAAGNYRNNRLEAALEELDKALKADPENADAYNMLGIIALRQGNDYLAQAESIACLKGQDAMLVREDAHRLFREAEQHFRRAVELRADYSEAWNNLSAAALLLQEWDVAIKAAGTALKDSTYPTPEVARANLGWAHYYKKEYVYAWRELHDAVSRAPNFCVGRYRLAKIYLERGEVDRAAEEVDVVVANKDCPIQEAFLLGGLVHERRRERERAQDLFDRCARLAPRSCIADECRRYQKLIQN